MFQAVSGIRSVIINWPYLDSVYVRTSYSWKEGHSSSQANFSERLHGKKLTPLREPRAGNSARACSMHGERLVRVIRLRG